MKQGKQCLDFVLDLWPVDHFELGFFASRKGPSELECAALSFESRLPVTILVAIAARDSGCQEVHRKWENHHGIQRIVIRLVIIQI